jgi:hypothetical protein
MSVYSYCMIMYPHCANWHSSATLTLRFFSVFSPVVRQMPGYNLQRWGTACTLPKFLCCSMYCLFCVILRFVCQCVLYYCHRVATQLQLTNVSYRISCITYHMFNLLFVVIKYACCTQHYVTLIFSHLPVITKLSKY